MYIRKIKHRLNKFVTLLQYAGNRTDFLKEAKELPGESRRLRRLKREIAAYLYQKTDGYVFSGPLSTLQLMPNSGLAQSPANLLGCYEQELHPILNEWIADPPVKLIDIGTSLGYYITGLATTMSNTRFVGFESVEEYRDQAIQLARFNQVESKISFRGHCGIAELNQEIEPGTVVLCDCEGGEMELLDPEKVPSLKTTAILCELHDFFAPGIGKVLVERFKDTHYIRFIDEQERNPSEYRLLAAFPDYLARYAIAETRHMEQGRVTSLRFAYLTPKARG